MAFKMNDTALYKKSSRKNSCSFKKSDEVDTTLVDNIYSKERVDKELIKMGYDPASRTTYGKTGIGGKINKNKVKKINQDMYNAPPATGGMVPVPTYGYLGGNFQ